MSQTQKISKNNTVVIQHFNQRRSVILHKTTIVEHDPASRTVTFDDGGWPTVTTRTRMNQVMNEWQLPFSVSRAGGVIRIFNRQTGAKLATVHGPTVVSY